MKIYLKEPNTNRIVEFQNEASIGAAFANWTRLTESEINAYELQESKDAKIAQCKAYLSSTDWQFTAFLERQRAIPENVATNRANAVLWQNLSDEELDNININFI